MSKATLEKRVAKLEQQMSEFVLHRQADGESSQEPGRDEWVSTIGMFDGDPVMKKIIDETLKIREKDRKRTRR